MKARIIRLTIPLVVVLPFLPVAWKLATSLVPELGLHDGDL